MNDENNGNEFSQVNSKRKPGKAWTPDEDLRLIEAVQKYGTNNWNFVVEAVGKQRNRGQCSQRWFRDLDPSITRGKWSYEEEKRLIDLVNEFGTKAWTKISRELGTRSDVQCRFHFGKMKRPETPTKTVSDPICATFPEQFRIIFEEAFSCSEKQPYDVFGMY